MISLRAQRLLGAENQGPWVSIDGDTVTAVGPQPAPGATAIDLGPVDLLPGLIDLHADTLAGKVFPRPSTELPLEAGLIDFDLEAVAYGITTPFLCVALEEDATKHRSIAHARRVTDTAAALAGELVTDLRLHLRVDVTGAQTGAATAEMTAAHPGLVSLISYMDHTPGQGQYQDEASWRESYSQSDGVGHTELDRRLAAKLAGADGAGAVRAQLAELARRYGCTLAAHDDDSAAAVERAAGLGARISEFPVNAAAARAAHALGLGTVMGAPNARRGRSHLTNLAARDALDAGCLDALASDYHPPSMLAAVYQLAGAGACSWEEAVALVTSGPARLAGLTDRGVIAAGRRADLVAVSHEPLPAVRATWIRGREVFRRGVPAEVHLMLTTSELREILDEMAGLPYGGEAVDQRTHALQCAGHALAAGEDPEQVVAAVLHDVGRVPRVVAAHPGMPHEEAGAAWCAARTTERIAWLVGAHVPAKRYLVATDPYYAATLSPASVASLRAQGGPFDEAEAAEFARHRWAAAAVALRRWDEAAKVPGLPGAGVWAVCDALGRALE